MPSYFSIDTFLTEVRDGGLAKPNRFEVLFPLPVGLSNTSELPENRLICLYCESANLPPKSIGVKQQRIYGPNYQRPFNSEYGGEGITMTFLVDGSMNVKGFFDAWTNIIVDPFQYFIHYPENYTVPITISQLDEQDNTTYAVTLEDAFPKNVASLELSQSSQNSVHKLSVTFTYRRWFSYHSIPNSIRYPEVWQTTVSNSTNPLQKNIITSSEDRNSTASVNSLKSSVTTDKATGGIWSIENFNKANNLRR